jgi:protein-disulfide isomerase
MIRYNLNFKLFFLIKVFFIYFIICLKSYADTPKALSDLVILGADNAPVKIKVFSSLTCPHCANFHIKIVPEIKKNYVESGKVQLIFIDFPLDQAAFNASKLLHCVDQKKQITFLDTVYENQDEWTAGSNINEINNNLKKIVQILGINSTQFDKCLNDEVISDKILNGRIDGHQKYSINSTPTIIINEKKLEGPVSFKNIKKKNRKTYLVYGI